MCCRVTWAVLRCDVTHFCVRHLAGYMYDRHVLVCVGAVTDMPGYVKPAPLAASLRTAGKPPGANLSGKDREA